MEECLFVYILDGASEPELVTWENLKRKTPSLDAITLEVANIGEWREKHQELELAGWSLASSGSGILQRVKTYNRQKEK